MRNTARFLIAIWFLAGGALLMSAETPVPVSASVETSLETDGKQIRQFAFDGDLKSYFASARKPTAADHFTIIFSKPVALKSVVATTGRPQGGQALAAGALEVSADAKTYHELAKFKGGLAKGTGNGERVLAIRLKPSTDQAETLAIREFHIESNPPVRVFKYPVEFVVDVSDAPELKDWSTKVARVCEAQYAMINDELRSPGFKPRTLINMRLKSDYKGVAYAGGGRITGSVKYFKSHPDDIGAMVHETVHCVQDYRTRGNPGWLVEGIADYIRFFKYEPGKLGKIRANAHYNGSYRTTAAFLAFVADKYDKDIVRKLNTTMREGEYKEEVWRALTKKSVQELDEEWRATFKK